MCKNAHCVALNFKHSIGSRLQKKRHQKCAHFFGQSTQMMLKHFKNAARLRDSDAIIDIIDNYNLSLYDILSANHGILYHFCDTKTECVIDHILAKMVECETIPEIGGVSWFSQDHTVFSWSVLLYYTIYWKLASSSTIIINKCGQFIDYDIKSGSAITDELQNLYVGLTKPSQSFCKDANIFTLSVVNCMTDCSLKIYDLIVSRGYADCLANRVEHCGGPFIWAIKNKNYELVQKMCDDVDVGFCQISLKDEHKVSCIKYLIDANLNDIALKCITYLSSVQSRAEIAIFVNTRHTASNGKIPLEHTLFTYACEHCTTPEIPLLLLKICDVSIRIKVSNKNDYGDTATALLFAINNKKCDMVDVIEELLLMDIHNGDNVEYLIHSEHLNTYIRALQIFQKNQIMSECPVCYETVLGAKLPCLHFLCFDCIARLEPNKYFCPLCRTDFRQF